MTDPLPSARDKLLFTPGPLTTSLSVKQAMLHDAGSWHFEFHEVVRWVRGKLLEIAGVSAEKGFECILMQGSGTFGVESVLATAIAPSEELLVLVNGAYGERITQMARCLKIPVTAVRVAENETFRPEQMREALRANPSIGMVAAIHCETTTGIINQVQDIGRAVKEFGKKYLVDAMSSFIALPLDLERAGVDYLVSSPNKCLEGVPGFSFVLARRESLTSCEGWARSLSLDLLGQWKTAEKTGQFRYTPPTHSILACAQAIRELEIEGGPSARAQRYQANHECLLAGMKKLGFKPYLSPELQSCIITSFHYPSHDRFVFDEFYRKLSAKGMIIYPGKLTQVNCFRIGSIGRLFPDDMRQLVHAIAETLEEMGIK